VIGLWRTSSYRVCWEDLASTIYPRVRKHPVLASMRVLEWLENEVMLCLDLWCDRVGRDNEWSLGHRVHLYHVRPAKLGKQITIRVACTHAGNTSSEWAVGAYAADRWTLALGTLGFVLADANAYSAQHLIPNQTARTTR
jgi:acyl-CoA thioesterase FadM